MKVAFTHMYTRILAEHYAVVENALDTLNCYDWHLFCAHRCTVSFAQPC